MLEDSYTGTFSFGPNQLSGVVDERFVKEYKVYFADSDHAKVSSAIATVNVETSRVPVAWCGCSDNLRSVTLNSEPIPGNATGLMVVVVDIYDFEMPVGTYIGGLTDVFTTTTTTTTATTKTTTATTVTATATTVTVTTTVTLKPIVSGAFRRKQLASWTSALLMIVSVIAALRISA